MGQALPSCEAFLNLFNRGDLVLATYPLMPNPDLRAALGRVGLLNDDVLRLGPRLSHYTEFDLNP